MATIKSCTELEQSKILAEILPLESADMMYQQYETVIGDDYGYAYRIQPFFSSDIDGIPCWSLGALISLLPKHYCLETLDNGTYVCYNFLSQYEKFGKTPIDAVYSMIVFLKEEKII